jgi:hypothetical protein
MIFGEKITLPQISEKWLKRIGVYEIANAGDILYFENVQVGRATVYFTYCC